MSGIRYSLLCAAALAAIAPAVARAQAPSSNPPDRGRPAQADGSVPDPSANVQTAPQANSGPSPTGEPDTSEVVVTGLRKSLQTAIQSKQSAPNVVEVLSSEDIGKLPDVSIGEALARLPGLAVNRDRGNATSISIRGLPEELTNTLLNGREIVSAEANRNVRFEEFPAELITGASVYKTPTTAQVEGAIAGQVDLHTVRPLDYKTPQVVLNARTSWNSESDRVPNADSVGAIGSASYVGQFLNHTLGVAVGYSGRYEPEATSRSDIYGYTNSFTDANNNGTFNDNVPYGFGASLRNGVDNRQAAIGTVQWEPTSRFSVIGDFSYAYLHYSEVQRGPVGNQVPYGDTFSNTTSQGDIITGSTVTNTGVSYGFIPQAANQFYRFTDILYAGGVNGQYKGDGYKLEADFGYSKTHRDAEYVAITTAPYSLVNGVYTPVLAGLSGSYQSNPGGPPIFGFDRSLSDPLTNLVTQIQIPSNGGGAPLTTDELYSGRLDGQFETHLPILDQIEAGFRITSRAKSYIQRTQTITIANPTPVPAKYLNAPLCFSGALAGYPCVESIDLDYANLFGGLHPMQADADKTASWLVTEKTYAAYVQGDFGFDLLSRPLSGNAGVRIVHTDGNSSSFRLRNGSDTNYVDVITPVSIGNDFTDVLPDLNLTWKVDPGLQIRFAASIAIARAPLDSLNAGIQTYTYQAPQSFGGNPNLKPYKAKQLDLTFERYFNKDTALTLSLFYKALDTFIVLQTTPTSVNVSGVTEQGTFQQPVNGSGGAVYGAEILYQQAFSFLPGVLSGFGFFGNYSHTESDISITQVGNDVGALTLPGLSKNVYNLGLYYNKSGFESRIAYRYRDGYNTNVAGNVLLVNNGSEGIVDYEASYEFSQTSRLKGVTLQFQANNLTNAPFTTNFNSASVPGRYELFGRRFYLGATYKFGG